MLNRKDMSIRRLWKRAFRWDYCNKCLRTLQAVLSFLLFVTRIIFVWLTSVYFFSPIPLSVSIFSLDVVHLSINLLLFFSFSLFYLSFIYRVCIFPFFLFRFLSEYCIFSPCLLLSSLTQLDMPFWLWCRIFSVLLSVYHSLLRWLALQSACST